MKNNMNLFKFIQKYLNKLYYYYYNEIISNINTI
uniref:Uncharacterized protein n=1 Tax=viral metagenome TaxID=1070528 RepID=A0A6C0KMJ4_9ZZZZ